MKLSTIITFAVFIFLVFIGSSIFIFWRFGILKESYEPSPLLEQIQNQLDYIKKYNFQEKLKNLQNLNTEKVAVPQINQEDLGRSSLFSSY